MIPRTPSSFYRTAVLLLAMPTALFAQKSPYDVFPAGDPPYYRVRYEASTQPGELIYPVNYTIWIPNNVKTLRGVVVHQHGCGEGSCKSGLTGAYDLHWQALAKKHQLRLLAPSYEQPNAADCQMWCDPRNGSDAAFQKCLADLGAKSGHPELATVPWGLWGHSGGGHWAGGMVLLHPERVAAAWLRSGVPLLKPNPERLEIKAHTLPDAALRVPLMCNLGTKEGVTVKDGRFARVWPANEVFFHGVRGKGGLIGVAVDPLTAHECGNQRYFAIPWLDACLSIRLPKVSGKPLGVMPTDGAWLANPTGFETVPAAKFDGDPLKAAWLPNEAVARIWMQYVKDTAVADTTPPPAPTNLRVNGDNLSWEAEADLESGLARFSIERDGKFLANVPERGKNSFGRPIFQSLQYSDTPTQPLVSMHFTDTQAEPGKRHTYRVIAVNTVGLTSEPTAVNLTEILSGRVDPKEKIEPYFTPPNAWRGKFGNYESPLEFTDGTRVKTPAEWTRRRAEIVAQWESLLGKWPPLITKPAVEILASERRENFTQHRIRFHWTPNEKTTGYLLVPDGEAPHPAVVTVYYEPETAIGLGNANRDFALQLARRGFVALSIGTTEASEARTYALYHPSIEDAKVEPLAMLGCAAANAWYVLANRPEVDAKRIGIVGHSFGGKWAMFASCLFDKFACAAWSDPGIVFDNARPSINYWEPWYLGYHPKPWRKRGLITKENPARGLYPKLTAAGRDLHELHALMAPRPFLVSGGSEDPPNRWEALNHTIEINRILGHKNRVAMTNRPDHSPNEDSNDVIYLFFEHFLSQPAE